MKYLAAILVAFYALSANCADVVLGDLRNGTTLGGSGADRVISFTFTPPSIPNLVAWWDAQNASSIQVSGVAVTNWTSLVGGYSAIATAGTAAPTLTNGVIGTNNSVSFDGGDLLTMTGGVNYTSVTCFAVFSRPTAARYSFPLSGAGGDLYLFAWSTDNKVYIGGVDKVRGYVRTTSASTSVGNFFCTSYSTGTNYANQLFRRNGTNIAVEAVATGAAGAVPPLLVLGGTSSQKTTGSFGEILVYGRFLTTNEIVAVEAYLKEKWGI